MSLLHVPKVWNEPDGDLGLMTSVPARLSKREHNELLQQAARETERRRLRQYVLRDAAADAGGTAKDVMVIFGSVAEAAGHVAARSARAEMHIEMMLDGAGAGSLKYVQEAYR